MINKTLDLFKKILIRMFFIIYYRINFVFGVLKKTFDFYYLKSHGVETKYGYVKLLGLPTIKKTPGSKIILNEGITLVSKTKYNIAGVNHPVILSTLSKDAVIEIGKVGISGATLCAATLIKIGNNSGLGANSKLYDTDFHCIDPIKRRQQKSILEAKSLPIVIEEDVWIASDVIILKGVTIGNGSIVGAGSVVTKSIPAYKIYAGNPAKKIRDI